MRNLVECNIVIPKIIPIHNAEDGEAVVQQLIIDNKIDPSHILLVKPEKEELTIDQIRQMQKDLQVTFSKQVLIVLYSLDNSSIEVQNSLLKILEEESERFLFILLVNDVTRLLPTINSRCSLINRTNIVSHDKERHKIENVRDFFSLKSNSDATKEMAVTKIDVFLQSGTINNTSHLQHILTIRKLILNNNMNPILALDSILLFLIKKGTMKVPNDKKT